jgi:hypothetical protein
MAAALYGCFFAGSIKIPSERSFRFRGGQGREAERIVNDINLSAGFPPSGIQKARSGHPGAKATPSKSRNRINAPSP